MSSSLRSLPSVDRLLQVLSGFGELPDSVLLSAIRGVLAERRTALLAGEAVPAVPVEEEVRLRLYRLLQPSLRSVINATGIILHTNLGRAPLAHFQPISRYSNLEYDLAAGRRGKRDVHTAGLLQHLLNAPAIVVNNNAAAVFLILHELAKGSEVIISRGELIEIGDGFRIPEIMARSGAILREVGTTNRTSLQDYREALSPNTKLILRVHPSNFQIRGFTAKPTLRVLCTLGKEVGIAVYEDLGSGCLVDLSSAGVHEPLVRESLDAGVAVVSFSCDKLLGGPQSGIIAGQADLIRRIRSNPMYRTMRVDKLVIESLESTLRELVKENWQALPALQMIFAPVHELRSRAQHIATALHHLGAEVCTSVSPIGGGSTPDQELPTVIVRIPMERPQALEQRLRRSDPPVIARIEKNALVLDMRTVSDEEAATISRLVLRAGSSLPLPSTEPECDENQTLD